MPIRRIIAYFVGVVGIVIVSASLFVGAQNNNEAGGNGLQISPTRTEIIGSKGEKKNFSLNVKNITKTTLSAKAVLNDFDSDGVSGTPQIIVNSTERTPYTLDKMLQGLQDIQLNPGQTKVLKFTLNIPSDVSPGAYFGAIRYQVLPKGSSDGERQVALNASVAHLVFLEVPGEINEQIKIESLKAQRDGKSASFFLKAPNEMALGVKNLGNGFSRPFGKLNINYFSKEAYAYDVNNKNPRGIVLPNSSRTFTDKIEGIKIPGRYSAIASVAYGSGGEVISYKTTFWYLPAWFLLLALIVLVAIGIGIRYVYKKRYNPTSKKKRTKK